MSEAFNTFKASLAAGKYKDITGARRALGKFHDLSPEDKAAAQKLADKHFNAAPAGQKAPKAAAPAGQKAAPAKRTPKAAPAESAAPAKGRGRKRSAPSPSASGTAVETDDAVTRAIGTSREVMGTMDQAIAAARSIKDVSSEADVSRVLDLAARSIETVQRHLMSVVSGGMNGAAAEPSATAAASQQVAAPTVSTAPVAPVNPQTVPGFPNALPGMPQR